MHTFYVLYCLLGQLRHNVYPHLHAKGSLCYVKSEKGVRSIARINQTYLQLYRWRRVGSRTQYTQLVGAVLDIIGGISGWDFPCFDASFQCDGLPVSLQDSFPDVSILNQHAVSTASLWKPAAPRIICSNQCIPSPLPAPWLSKNLSVKSFSHTPLSLKYRI